VRFIVGYTAVAIAAATFYLDRQLGWEAVEAPWVKAAVVSYFILNSILTYWIWAVEAGEVFRGSRKSGETVCFNPYQLFSRSALKKLEASCVQTLLYILMMTGRSRFEPPQRSTPQCTN
jgi:hypothetical protein